MTAIYSGEPDERGKYPISEQVLPFFRFDGDPRTLANARLIAAAPALLEALVAALHDLETSSGLMACDNDEGHSLFQLTHPSTQQVIAAIAAARGEGVTA